MAYTVAKYLRISSEDIDLDGLDKCESESIANQRILLDRFIKKTPEFSGCAVVEMIDDGRSGTNFNRPGIIQLLDMAKRGDINCIIVKDLSRFGRNLIEAGDYLEQIFPAWGTRFISVNDMYDSAALSDAAGGIDIAFRSLIAEMYSQDLSDKVRSARVLLNKSGRTTAPYAFYGYMKDANDKHKLIIDNDAAEIVRLVYNMREAGLVINEIVRRLNSDGVPTPNMRKFELGIRRNWRKNGKNDLWTANFIHHMLSDERYTGKHIYGKRKQIIVGRRDFKLASQSEWIVVDNIYPAIISEEQYRRVQKLAHTKSPDKSCVSPDKSCVSPGKSRVSRGKSCVSPSKSRMPPGKNLLFYRKITCGHCGRALYRAKSKDGYIYRCHTAKIAEGLSCMKGDIPESAIIDIVLTLIRKQAALADDNIVKIKAVQRDINTLRSKTKNLRRLIEKTQSSKMSLWEKYHAGHMTKEAFRQERDKLSEQAATCESKITAIENEMRELEIETGCDNLFIERYSKQSSIQTLTRGVVDEFVKSICVYDTDSIKIILNYADEHAKIQAQVDTELPIDRDCSPDASDSIASLKRI